MPDPIVALGVPSPRNQYANWDDVTFPSQTFSKSFWIPECRIPCRGWFLILVLSKLW